MFAWLNNKLFNSRLLMHKNQFLWIYERLSDTDKKKLKMWIYLAIIPVIKEPPYIWYSNLLNITEREYQVLIDFLEDGIRMIEKSKTAELKKIQPVDYQILAIRYWIIAIASIKQLKIREVAIRITTELNWDGLNTTDTCISFVQLQKSMNLPLNLPKEDNQLSDEMFLFSEVGTTVMNIGVYLTSMD
ncbi:MAG: hypothetical protein E6Q33_02665 [Neisseriales bacterium]|nr:MAG: hypothetical protein E6Q33_02665 [Neisseriales bacterium]